MKAILSADLDNGIGKNGGLLIRIPEDMKRFRRMTMGGTVIMGRKTYLSLPDKKPLPGRKNIILSKTLGDTEGFIVVKSTEELFKEVSPDDENAFVIGGGEIYALLLPYCTDIYLTVIEHHLDADTFFPDISPDEWRLVGMSATFTHDFIKYHYEDYKKKGL